MNLLSTIVAALAPTVATLTQQFGITVTVYRPTDVDAPSGERTRSYTAPDATLTAVPAFFTPARGDATDAGESAVRPYGITPVLSGSLRFPPLANGVLPALNALDGLKVLDGPYAGYTFLADSESAPDAAGVFTIVRVMSAPAGVIP